MGIFSGFKTGDIDAAAAETAEPEAPEGVLDLEPEVGTYVKVYVFGEPLLTGTVETFSPESLTIRREAGQRSFGVRSPGTPVMIRSASDAVTAYVLKGRISISSRDACRIVSLEAVPYSDQRRNFRLSVDAPMQIYDWGDRNLELPEEGRLVNISAGGLCVRSKCLHDTGEALRFRVLIPGCPAMTLPGQIVRVEEPGSGLYYYGVRFEGLNEQQSDALSKAIWDVQRVKAARKRYQG